MTYTYRATVNPRSSSVPDAAECMLLASGGGFLSCTVADLLSSTLYVVTLQVCDTAHYCRLLSYPLDFTTLPSGPTKVLVSNRTSTSIHVFCSPAKEDGVSEDYTYTATAQCFGSVAEVCTTTEKKTHCTIRDLQPDTNCSLTVMTCTAAGVCGAPSESVIVKTLLAGRMERFSSFE
ncbi:unnamed protein product [Schistocephalus solidus]|uniref:Fibronectin type-III domain-containing protein n=1 Tax=Schistocephalus solidus TaxID=70667 RepID=A0A183SBX7_SCHSO|nr:unnamed protein product [Schistocephalus solidus]